MEQVRTRVKVKMESIEEKITDWECKWTLQLTARAKVLWNFELIKLKMNEK